MCSAAKYQFAFFEEQGFILTKEQLPSGNSFKDGFHLTFSRRSLSIIVEDYDMELVILFQRGSEKIPYLFVNHELTGSARGFAGCMFTRHDLPGAIARMAQDIDEKYGAVLLGDENVWKKMSAMWHTPRVKRKLP